MLTKASDFYQYFGKVRKNNIWYNMDTNVKAC